MQGLNKTIYMDNAATTALLPEVLDAMMPYLTKDYGNASSIHLLGYKAKLAIEEAREKIAELLDCEANNIYFTSGATESNNWILTQSKFQKIITTKLEHDSVYNTCQFLSKSKTISYLKNDCFGNISCDDLFHLLLSEKQDLVSIIWGNNEIGTIQQIEKIKKICDYTKTPFHSDATQVLGHIPISINKERINYLSASGHKLGGPKGIGILYSDSELEPFMKGGHQENGLRGGTYNTPNIVGFGKACELAKERMDLDQKELIKKQIYMSNLLIDKFSDCTFTSIRLNTCIPLCLPSYLNLSFKNLSGEGLMLMLSEKGIICSTGSACNSGTKINSRVLEAIGVTGEYISGTLRFTLNNDVTYEDIDYVVNELYECAKYLCSLNM